MKHLPLASRSAYENSFGAQCHAHVIAVTDWRLLLAFLAIQQSSNMRFVGMMSALIYQLGVK